MIYDTLEHLDRYCGLNPAVLRGLTWLRDADLASMTDGRYELDGDDLYVSLSTYTTRKVNDRPEAHRAYADIQFLAEGAEEVGVAPLEEMNREVEAKPEGDIWFYSGSVENLTLTGRRFMVFFPGDAHAPCIAPHGQEQSVRKCLLKVKL
jgi:YhcH/YjgK/YiaL family protein